ncbi:unnamed protein product [Fusarium venenatum]|uniref:Uncharacterized protein n=1 Tax=Fusarium venenatum TaxID=56646 RepID=A0A2L2U3Z7_9HYPO|nr:uncharacterized protein FVRRES_09732 [Fusarium venenatum]CEI69655.1 unnamed protein product [Fusarium venenatum]
MSMPRADSVRQAMADMPRALQCESLAEETFPKLNKLAADLVRKDTGLILLWAKRDIPINILQCNGQRIPRRPAARTEACKA